MHTGDGALPGELGITASKVGGARVGCRARLGLPVWQAFPGDLRLPINRALTASAGRTNASLQTLQC